MVRALAIVPARGGSQSIPRKNVRELGGHPLLAWSVAAALEARHVERVIVSTDDAEIRDAAVRYGAEAPFVRPAALAAHDTTDHPVFAHALRWLEVEEGYTPDVVVQLRPTSPLRPRGLVDRAVQLIAADPTATCVRAVTPAGQNPFKMWRRDGRYLAPLLAGAHGAGDEPFDMPRQALPSAFWQTGHVDVVRRATILDFGSMTGPRVLPVQVDPSYAVDIDTRADWAHADRLLREGALDVVRPPAHLGGGADDPAALFSRVRLVVLDFDGVMTDNRVYVDQDGGETVACDRSDGLGLAMLRARGVPVWVLSTEVNPVVAARCAKLGIPCRHGLADKAMALRALCAELDVPLDHVCYVGNDANDRDCLRLVGIPAVVADAHPCVRAEARWTLSQPGGRGAVRELCDLLLHHHCEAAASEALR